MRARSYRMLVLASLLWRPGAPATAEVQTQHIADTSMRIGRIEPLWHFRVRTTPQGGGLAQIRTGPILTASLHERIELIGGYYFTREKEDGIWATTHRGFGGLEATPWNRGIEVETRSLVERLALEGRPDSFRFRNRVRFSPVGATAPYIGAEMFHDAEGLRSMRYSAGIRRTIDEELILDFGYFYENRRSGTGSDRHMIGTTIHWRNKARRIDPDQ